MGKVKKKLNLISPYNIAAYESWLSNNAEKGLFLSKWKKYFCQFEKDEPKKMEYRIEISSENLSRERKQLYEDAGWKYVDSLKMAHIFCSPTEDRAIEIHTDGVEHAKTLIGLKSNLKAVIIIFSVMLAIFLGTNIWILNMDGTPFISIVDYGSLNIFNIAPYFILIIIFFKMFNDVRIFKKSLLKGVKIDHHKNWKKSYAFEVSTIVISLIALVFMISSIVSSITSNKRIENDKLINKEISIPIVTLIELEGSEINYSKNNDIEFSSYITKKSNLFCKIKEEAMEDAATNDGSFNVGLNTTYYEAQFKFLAKGLLSDLLKHEIKQRKEMFYKDSEYKKIQNDYFDEFYYLEDYGINLYVRKDNKVFIISYSGTQTKEYLLEKLEENLNSK